MPTEAPARQLRRDALRRASGCAVVSLLLCAGAAASDGKAPDARARIRGLLEGLESWRPPPKTADMARLCLSQLPARFNLRPLIPNEEARSLDLLFASHQRSEGFLCGREPSCGQTEKDFGSQQCEIAVKVGFVRGVLSESPDAKTCRTVAQRAYGIKWSRSMRAADWDEVCRQVVTAITRKDLTICSREGALGRFAEYTEEARKNCLSHFFFLEGIEACEKMVSIAPDGQRVGAMDLDECRAVASLRAAFSGAGSAGCGGNRFCLAGMRDPAACAKRYPHAVDVLLGDNPSECGDILLCRQLHDGAAPFREGNRSFRAQMDARCQVEAQTRYDQARRGRMDALADATRFVRAVAQEPGFDDPALEREALRRIEEMTRKADALSAVEGPPLEPKELLRTREPEKG